MADAVVTSGSLDLATTGSKTAVINHGLSNTPDINKCMVSMIRETAVADCVIGFMWVEAVSSTTVTVRARVTTASATAGATFKTGRCGACMTLGHPIAALVIQGLISAITGNWWAGAAFGAAFFHRP